jgi:hypothetical protein
MVSPNGNQRKMADCRNITARLDVAVEEFRCIGEMMHRHKGVGVRGSGSMNIYTGTPEFLKFLNEFLHNKINYRFQIYCEIRDPEAEENRGTRVIQLTDVLLHGAQLFKLDTEDGILDEDIEFDFDNFKEITNFNEPTNDPNIEQLALTYV